jgi:hypothetical protein
MELIDSVFQESRKLVSAKHQRVGIRRTKTAKSGQTAARHGQEAAKRGQNVRKWPCPNVHNVSTQKSVKARFSPSFLRASNFQWVDEFPSRVVQNDARI